MRCENGPGVTLPAIPPHNQWNIHYTVQYSTGCDGRDTAGAGGVGGNGIHAGSTRGGDARSRGRRCEMLRWRAVQPRVRTPLFRALLPFTLSSLVIVPRNTKHPPKIKKINRSLARHDHYLYIPKTLDQHRAPTIFVPILPSPMKKKRGVHPKPNT